MPEGLVPAAQAPALQRALDIARGRARATHVCLGWLSERVLTTHTPPEVVLFCEACRRDVVRQPIGGAA